MSHVNTTHHVQKDNPFQLRNAMANTNVTLWKIIAALSLITLIFQNLRSAVNFCQQFGAWSESQTPESASFSTRRTASSSSPPSTTSSTTTPSPWINFLHIGKNAGYFVEQLGKAHDYQCGVWGSRMNARGGINAPPPRQGSWMTPSRDPFNPKATEKSRLAYEWHLPPEWLTEPDRRNEMYRHPDTFCIIRHPLDRLLSAYYYQHIVPSTIINPLNKSETLRIFNKGPCVDDSPAEANRILYETLQRVATNDACHQSCHYLPQSRFLAQHHTLGSGLRNKDNNGHIDLPNDNPYKQCNRVLVLEFNLTRQINELMEDIGCPIRALAAKPRQNSRRPKCPSDASWYINGTANPMYAKEYNLVSPDDLSDEVLDLARKVYADDFALYDYYSKKIQESQKHSTPH